MGHERTGGYKPSVQLKPDKPILPDPVNHPSHYCDGGIETADFIEAKGLNWQRGNAIKYISRAGKKDPDTEAEDIRKAIWYLERDVARMTAHK